MLRAFVHVFSNFSYAVLLTLSLVPYLGLAPFDSSTAAKKCLQWSLSIGCHDHLTRTSLVNNLYMSICDGF